MKKYYCIYYEPTDSVKVVTEKTLIELSKEYKFDYFGFWFADEEEDAKIKVDELKPIDQSRRKYEKREFNYGLLPGDIVKTEEGNFVKVGEINTWVHPEKTKIEIYK